MSGILRDFKKYTSSEIVRAIEASSTESRRAWLVEIFRKAGSDNTRNTMYQFWRQDNRPMECYSPDFTKQKLDYIHHNPVTAGIVDRDEDYIYSSARDYCGIKGLLEIDFL